MVLYLPIAIWTQSQRQLENTQMFLKKRWRSCHLVVGQGTKEWFHEGLPTRLSRELRYMMGRGGIPQTFLVVVGCHILLLNLRINRAHIISYSECMLVSKGKSSTTSYVRSKQACEKINIKTCKRYLSMWSIMQGRCHLRPGWS